MTVDTPDEPCYDASINDGEKCHMNFIEALNTGRIAVHPMMIGGWMMIEGKAYHRDNYDDFNYPEWIKENCGPYRIVMSGDEWHNMCENNWETV